MRKTVLIVAFLLVASCAFAQPPVVLNPTRAEFIKSADHDAVYGGVLFVTRYELRHYLVGTEVPVSVYDLGKPTPDANGLIVAVFPPLAPDVAKVYFARVVSIGPEGEGVSPNSENTYVFTGVPAAPGQPSIKR